MHDTLFQMSVLALLGCIAKFLYDARGRRLPSPPRFIRKAIAQRRAELADLDPDGTRETMPYIVTTERITIPIPPGEW